MNDRPLVLVMEEAKNEIAGTVLKPSESSGNSFFPDRIFRRFHNTHRNDKRWSNRCDHTGLHAGKRRYRAEL